MASGNGKYCVTCGHSKLLHRNVMWKCKIHWCTCDKYIEPEIVIKPSIKKQLEYLRADLATASAEYAALIEQVKKLKHHLSAGDYSISRADGGAMFIGETLMFDEIFEKIDKMIGDEHGTN